MMAFIVPMSTLLLLLFTSSGINMKRKKPKVNSFGSWWYYDILFFLCNSVQTVKLIVD